MARTTAALVAAICEADDGDDLAPFILTANELVTELCVPAGYSTTRLELIERWLAAHFYRVDIANSLSETTGPLQDTIESKVDLGLNVTRWGQQAMILDTAGKLAAVNNATQKVVKRTKSILWLGTEPT